MFVRATERLIACDRLSAFSKSSDITLPNENGGDKREAPLGTAMSGQSQSERLEASIVPEQEDVIPAPCAPGSSHPGHDLYSTCGPGGRLSGVQHSGTEWCVDSAAGQAAKIESTVCPVHPNSHPPEIELDEEHAAPGDTGVHGDNFNSFSGLSAPPNEALVATAGLGKGAEEEAEDDDLAAADWLDVTHALLEELSACR